MILKKRKLLIILLSLVGIYLITSIGFYFVQERFIFQPTKSAADFKFEFENTFQEYTIQTRDGITLSALLFSPKTESKGLILYFHGNAGNLQRWGKYSVDFTNLGYSILMVDYRGYGKSTGNPGEKEFYDDAETILHWANSTIPHTKTIYYGRSLGSAVASKLATLYKPDLLILETPFDELKGVIYPPMRALLSLFPTRFSFSNKEYLPLIKCKKIIFHGTNDWIVPVASAEKLKPLLSSTDHFYLIEGGGHRNLRDFPEFHTALADILK